MSGKEYLSFDVGLYQNGIGGLRSDLAALTLEHQIAPEEERIVPYKLIFDRQGEPVGFKPRWTTEKDFEENKGMYSMRDLALEGKKYMLWISPASEKWNLPESRMVIGIVNLVGTEGVEIDCRALSITEGLDYCLNIAGSLGLDVDNESELRSRAISFEVENDDWINTLRKIINKDKIWTKIESGEDVELKKKREAMMDDVIDRFGEEVRVAKTSVEQILVGARIEQMVMGLGISLSTRGDCGVLNSTLMMRLPFGVSGSFDYVFTKSVEAYFDCPKCKGKIPSGKGIETCPHCGAKKKDYKSNCD